jgi:hypothetical protein
MTATPGTLDRVAPNNDPAPEVGVPLQILITENEVAFSTAAAVSMRRTTRHRWTETISVVLRAAHRMFLTSTSDPRTPRRHYPKQYAFLESSCLAREMDRL